MVCQGALRPQSIMLQPLEALAGGLLIVGLWTPVAGVTVVVCELWTAITTRNNMASAVLLAAIGAALAMLGPGSTSLDNRFFGRKRFDLPHT
jgi:uncharacterized membrane protein YphA (DoxX/SURF4 family)